MLIRNTIWKTLQQNISKIPFTPITLLKVKILWAIKYWWECRETRTLYPAVESIQYHIDPKRNAATWNKTEDIYTLRYNNLTFQYTTLDVCMRRLVWDA
jgi:hypothetical protein